MSKPTLVAVLGPTASGKTALSIEIAKFLRTEIISCDSRQFYRELAIGSAPPSAEELSEAPHHFIADRSAANELSAGQFAREATQVVSDVFSRCNDHAVLVGGSGLFADALMYGFDEMPSIPESFREELNDQYRNEGLESLLKELKEKDAAYYDLVDRKNPVRIIRALEIIRHTGNPFSQYRKQSEGPKKSPYHLEKIAIDWDREALYDRINHRVDLMMEAGLLEEVKSLLPYRHLQSLNTVGYSELFAYLEGDIDLDFAVSEIKKNTRRFAKRQLTWLRKDSGIFWVKPDDQALETIKKHFSWD
ncbi:MAG: tRNA (adenosine(37)-N6)-dimethylallyltransferase MiaA [Schleiferiaceae bacterium]